MEKPRLGYGRSRLAPKLGRRTAAAPQERELRAAERTATAFVAARWPELAAVRPSVVARRPLPPSPELLARLGLDRHELPGNDRLHFIVTFCGVRATVDGHQAPVVAVVVVDERQQIVKASLSR